MNSPYTAKVPLRLIEREFKGETDVLGDLILETLSEFRLKHREEIGLVKIEVDFLWESDHPNPWYHYVLFTIKSLPKYLHSEFEDFLQEAGVPIETTTDKK